MIFARGVTTVVAIATRSGVGGSVGGFVAVLNAVGSIALYAFLLTLARGALMGTGLEGLVAIPVVLPLGALATVLVVVWVLRGLGWRVVGGPLVSDTVPDSFTGHAATVWWRLAKTRREWTILERFQPTVLVTAGLVLCIPPWTRAVGLFLLIVALLASRRAAAERRTEAEHEQRLLDNDPYAMVVAPPKGMASTPSYRAQLLEMAPPYRTLLDERTLADLESDRERILREEGAVSRPPIDEALTEKPVFRKQRPTVPYGNTSRNILVVTLLVVANFAAGDIVGLYRFLPGGLTRMTDSLDRETAILRPLQTQTELGTGPVTRGLLAKVDPAGLQDREAQARVAAQAGLRATLDAFADAMGEERRTGRRLLGVEFHPDAGTADFDALLLEDQDALRVWERLLGVVGGLDADLRAARAFADGIGPSATGEAIRDANASADDLLGRLAAVAADRETLHTKLTARRGRTP